MESPCRSYAEPMQSLWSRRPLMPQSLLPWQAPKHVVLPVGEQKRRTIVVGDVHG